MPISKRQAQDIASKLCAEIKNGRKHEIAIIRHNGYQVASYGIRRSSRDKSHDFIPNQLHISGPQTADLARCSLDRDGYFALLAAKGILPSN